MVTSASKQKIATSENMHRVLSTDGSGQQLPNIKGPISQRDIDQAKHSEYANNIEDYSQSRKDELIKTLIKKRKDNFSAMDARPNLMQNASVSHKELFEGME